MIDALGIFGLLALLFGGKGAAPSRARGGGGSRPQLPAGDPAPWPQVVPKDLAKFPGSGWEFDEPPPPAVQQRAAQLVTQLWKAGAGTFKTEQTAGRWITYRAEKVRSGNQGVVAYRLKSAAPALRPPAPAPSATQVRPPASVQVPPQVYSSPGLPPVHADEPVADPMTGMPIPSYHDPAASPAPAYHDPAAPAPALSPLGMPVLKMGDGLKPAAPLDDVKLVQQKLGIAADGRFGAGTRDAVIQFQVKTGLAPNLPIAQLRQRGFGAVKEATWVKLFAVRAP